MVCPVKSPRRPAADHPASGVTNQVELAVAVAKFERDSPRCSGTRRTDLGNLEFDPIRQIYPDTMLVPGGGAYQRSADRFEQAGDRGPATTPVDVDLDLDWREDWSVYLARHRMKDPPVGLGLLGLPAVENSQECLSLMIVRALVDDGLHLAVALVDRAGPCISDREAKSAQLHLGEMAAFDPRNFEASAIPVCGIKLELTRAVAVAGTVTETDRLNAPVYHGNLSPIGVSLPFNADLSKAC
jgi:hypothetical protein